MCVRVCVCACAVRAPALAGVFSRSCREREVLAAAVVGRLFS